MKIVSLEVSPFHIKSTKEAAVWTSDADVVMYVGAT
jgi:hypothetical protein